MAGVVRLESRGAVEDWRRELGKYRFSSLTPLVTFALPQFDEQTNRSLTARANRLRGACGCNEAALVFISGLAIAVVIFATDGQSLRATPLWQWGATAAVLVGAMTAAKMLALLASHRRLLRLADRTTQQLDDYGAIAIG